MEIETFEKAKTIQNEIEFLRERKKIIKSIRNDNLDVRFGIFANCTHLSLNKEEIEYISNFLIKKCNEEINDLENKFSQL